MDSENGVQQTGFSAGVSSDSPSTSIADSTQTTETHTNDSPSPDVGGGSQPPAAANTGAEDNTLAQSEKGSFKLVFNERTGRNEVVSTMPTETEPEEESNRPAEPQQQVQKEEQKPAEPQKAPDNYNGNELLQYMQMVRQQAAQAYYPPQPPPQPVQQPVPQQQPAPAPQPVDETAQAKEYYANVNKMARERAMREVGITQDELDVAEYSDDKELLDKVAAYRTAIENNKSQIMRDVDNIRRTWEAERADHANAYQAVAAFVQDMKQKEPNFDAIDKMMISRVAKMPYEQAVKLAPLILKVQNGTLNMADLPALQDMYNQTRLEFYSKKEGVGLAPKVTKPAFVETPGTGKEPPKKTAPLSALGTMSKRDREAAIGQMFGSFFDD